MVSSHIHRELKVGQLVTLKPPGGVFVIPLRSRQPVVLFAGGIGITPFLSYLETLARQSEAPDVSLFYANRSRATHAFKRQIAELQQLLPSLTVVNCYAREEAGCDMSGRLSADVVDENLIRQRARFYFCGPEPMMNSITDQLVARGVPPFDIFREVFKSPFAPKIDPTQKFSVTFTTARKTIDWTPDMGSLLSFAEQSGVSIPSGCRVGQCESCSVRVISGAVEHMSGDGPEEPGMCLACQAIPASDITIDA